MATKKTLNVGETAKLDMPEMKVETPFAEFMEHQKNSVREFGKAVETLIPEGLLEHGEAAVRESVEGYRKFFNATLDEIVKFIEKVRITEQPKEAEKEPQP